MPIEGERHKCKEAHEEVSALHANGNMRVSVYCDCGRFIRSYIDSVN